MWHDSVLWEGETKRLDCTQNQKYLLLILLGGERKSEEIV